MIRRLQQSIFVKSFVIYFFGLLLSGAINFFSIPLITHKYSVEVYGKFSLIQNVVMILISFAGGWLNQCVLRFYDASSTFKYNIYGLCFVFFLPSAVLCFVIAIFLSGNFLVAVMAAVTMVVGGVSALTLSFHQARFHANQTLYLNLLRAVLFVGLLFGLFFTVQYIDKIVLLVFSLLASFLLSYLPLHKKDIHEVKLSLYLLLRRYRSLGDMRVLFANNAKFVSYGMPLAIWFTMSSVLSVADRYIINYYLPGVAVGNYSSIYDLITKTVVMICSPILIAGYPLMAKKFNEDDRQGALRMIVYFLLLELGILAVSYFAIINYQGLFLRKVLGLAYTRDNVAVLKPILLGVFVWQFAMLAQKPLELFSKTGVMLWCIIIALVANVVLNLVFVRQYGIVFAAYSTLGCAAVYLVLVVFFSLYYIKRQV